MDTNSLASHISPQIVEDVSAALATIPKSEAAIIQPMTLDARVLDGASAAALIDHTLLKPNATEAAIEILCTEAQTFGFASVCVNLTWLERCRELLTDSSVKTCVVIGFPLGATSAAVKAFETSEAVKLGVDEVDMVINVGQLKDKRYSDVYADIAGVVNLAHSSGALVKVILETALLDDDEKVAGCLVAKEAGADFVKTSTGFSGGGATESDIKLMRQTVGPRLGVKASGGVRTAADMRTMIAAGATRIGASAGVAIVEGFSTDDNEGSISPENHNKSGETY